jgi:hypothetical protein
MWQIPLRRTALALALAAVTVAAGTASATAAPARPATNLTSCGNPSHKVEITTWDGNTTCFDGTGYLAFRLNGIHEVKNIKDFGWLKVYPRGTTDGRISSFTPNTGGLAFGTNPYWDMTQICLHC